MKITIHTKSSFRSADSKELKRAVTQRIGRLINSRLRMNGGEGIAKSGNILPAVH